MDASRCHNMGQMVLEARGAFGGHNAYYPIPKAEINVWSVRGP